MQARIHRKRTRIRTQARMALACAAAHACRTFGAISHVCKCTYIPMHPAAAARILDTCITLHEIAFHVALKSYARGINALQRMPALRLMQSAIDATSRTPHPGPCIDRMLEYTEHARHKHATLQHAHGAAQRTRGSCLMRIRACLDALKASTRRELSQWQQHLPKPSAHQPARFGMSRQPIPPGMLSPAARRPPAPKPRSDCAAEIATALEFLGPPPGPTGPTGAERGHEMPPWQTSMQKAAARCARVHAQAPRHHGF